VEVLAKRAGARVPGGLILAMIAVLVVPMAFPALASPLAPLTAAVDDVAKPSCAGDWDPEAFTETLAYQALFETFAGEPGFVDLYVGYGVDGPALTALFDLDARAAPLPGVPAIAGLEVDVVGERFVPLMVPLEEVDGWLAAEPPLIPGACPTGIRPGARVSTPVGGCTANFIFTDQHGRWYVGTAGHCFGGVGQRMSVSGIGDVGSAVYSTGNGGVGTDFALVLIDADKEHWVNPAMCHWGGPTSESTGPTEVKHYGHGVGHGLTVYTRPRTGYFAAASTDSFSFYGAVASGDSGSGAIRANGAGLGVITHVNAGAVLLAHSAPWAYGTRLDRAISLAENGTGLDLTLQTAPLV
jgi:hypothetical protein